MMTPTCLTSATHATSGYMPTRHKPMSTGGSRGDRLPYRLSLRNLPRRRSRDLERLWPDRLPDFVFSPPSSPSRHNFFKLDSFLVDQLS